MKSKFIIKFCAVLIAALMTMPIMAAPTPDRRKSTNRTTTTRSHKRIDTFRQNVDKNRSNSNTQRQQTNSYRSSGTTNYNTSTSSSSSSSDNTNRKIFLKNQITDWKNKLKKAEKSYEDAVASGEDTWEKQSVVESKRKTVNECLEMIRQYESELNSLK